MVRFEVGKVVNLMELPQSLAKHILGETIYRMLRTETQKKIPVRSVEVVAVDREARTVTVRFSA